MVTTVYGAVDNLPELCPVCPHGITPVGSAEGVVVGVGHVEGNGVSSREVEDHEVVALYLS